MHLLTSAIFHINNHPVSYNLFLQPDTMKYLFAPSCLLTAWHLAPSFWLHQKGSEWLLHGTDIEEIRQQAIEKLSAVAIPV